MQINVLNHVWIGVFACKRPCIATAALRAAAGGEHGAFRAVDDLFHFAVRVVLLAAHGSAEAIIGILVMNREVIVDGTECRLGTNLATTGRNTTKRRATHRPIHYINIVYVLLNDMVARQPGVVKPIANLILNFGELRIWRLIPQTTLIPIATRCDWPPDGAILNLCHRLDVAAFVPTLRPRHDAQFPLCSARGCIKHRANSTWIHCHWLLKEDVLTGVNRRRKVRWSEARRSCKNHHVAVSGKHLAVGIKA